MSAKYVSRAWELQLKSTQKLILLALADNANQTGEAVLGLAKLSKLSGLGIDTCSLTLKTLENQGLIAITRCGNRPSLVSLLFGESQNTGKSDTYDRLGNGIALALQTYKSNVIRKKYPTSKPYLRLVTGEKNRGEGSVRGEGDLDVRVVNDPSVSVGAPDVGPAEDAVSVIYNYWRLKLHPKARLGNKRRGVIQRALKLYDVEDLKLAVDGCMNSAFHMGKNDEGKTFDSIELILRDEKHIEDFMAMGESPPVAMNSAEQRQQENVEVMKEWIEEDGPQPTV